MKVNSLHLAIDRQSDRDPTDLLARLPDWTREHVVKNSKRPLLSEPFGLYKLDGLLKEAERALLGI